MAHRHPLHRHRGPSLAKPRERTLKRPEEALHPERFQIGIGGEIISEWWAISFRNHRRFEIGMMGDFTRNQQFNVIMELLHETDDVDVLKAALAVARTDLVEV